MKKKTWIIIVIIAVVVITLFATISYQEKIKQQAVKDAFFDGEGTPISEYADTVIDELENN
jgi:peptidoglycan hydrolase CwlO-like protein